MPNVIEINDFSAPELDIYARLTENQLVNRADPENALFIAESPVVIERALDAGCMPVSMLMETKHVEGKGRELIARCGDIPVFAAPLEVLTELTGFHLTRGMLCAMHRRTLPAMEEICRNARRVAILENVVNPFCRRTWHRCRAPHIRLQQPAVPPRHPREHGKCLPGPVDRAARRQLLAGAGNCCTAGTWILYRCDGIKRRLRSDG